MIKKKKKRKEKKEEEEEEKGVHREAEIITVISEPRKAKLRRWVATRNRRGRKKLNLNGGSEETLLSPSSLITSLRPSPSRETVLSFELLPDHSLGHGVVRPPLDWP